MDLLTDKGIYPYDYFDDFERFKERALRPKEAFYSKLSEGVSHEGAILKPKGEVSQRSLSGNKAGTFTNRVTELCPLTRNQWMMGFEITCYENGRLKEETVAGRGHKPSD